MGEVGRRTVSATGGSVGGPVCLRRSRRRRHTARSRSSPARPPRRSAVHAPARSADSPSRAAPAACRSPRPMALTPRPAHWRACVAAARVARAAAARTVCAARRTGPGVCSRSFCLRSRSRGERLRSGFRRRRPLPPDPLLRWRCAPPLPPLPGRPLPPRPGAMPPLRSKLPRVAPPPRPPDPLRL